MRAVRRRRRRRGAGVEEAREEGRRAGREEGRQEASRDFEKEAAAGKEAAGQETAQRVQEVRQERGATAGMDEVLDRVDVAGDGRIDCDELFEPANYEEALSWVGGTEEVAKWRSLS